MVCYSAGFLGEQQSIISSAEFNFQYIPFDELVWRNNFSLSLFWLPLKEIFLNKYLPWYYSAQYMESFNNQV